MMQNRISQIQDDEVDYLRFDRIKIQRKRMQHILQVIKDLSFKNKELFKENAALKEESLHQGHYQKLYRQLMAEKTILIDKNLQIGSQLEKYRQTVLHQEILINSLKRELYGQSFSNYRSNIYELEHNEAQFGENRQLTQEHKILQAQYEDLKNQYSKLYKAYTSKENLNKISSHNRNSEVLVCGKQNDKSSKTLKSCSTSKFICEQINQNEESSCLVMKYKEKYDKCKKAKKELANEIKNLRDTLSNYQLREQRHVELIQVLKQKKTKICLCHVNKLKKKMSQPLLESMDNPHEQVSHN